MVRIVTPRIAVLAVMVGVLLFFGGMCAASGEEYSGAIDTYLARQMKGAGIPNLSLGIVKDGEIVYLQSYGRDFHGETGAKEDIYAIGSIGKTFTALAVRQLVGTGAIDEQAPVQSYLPDFHAEYAGKDANITVGQLIHHTSGISAFAGGAPYIYNPRHSLEKIIDKSMYFNLVHQPGTVYEYSNMNYLILGRLVEIASGQRYTEYIRERILTPLGMENTYPDVTELRGKAYMRAYLPFYGTALPVSYPFPAGMAPAGGLFTTAEDLCRFMICYQQGGYVNGLSLIAGNPVPAPEADADGLHYDIYWTVLGKGDTYTLNHNGAWPGYSSSMLMDPSSGYGVVVLANSFDQLKISVSAPTPWSMAEDILAFLNSGHFPEQMKVSWNYSLIVWIIVLVSGMAAFAVVTVRREIHRIVKPQKISKIAAWAGVHFALPVLWFILVPVVYDSGWGWLIASLPTVNLSILFVMATLVLTGIVSGIGMLRKGIKT